MIAMGEIDETRLDLAPASSKAGDVERLWHELSGPLLAYFQRQRAAAGDAEDLLQECFLRVVRGIGAVQDEDRLAGWVKRIARNLVVDARRAERPAADPDEPAPEPAAPPAGEAGDSEDLERMVAGWIARRIADLPGPYRDVVRLFELEGVPQVEIAERLGLSRTAVKSRVRRGRALLRSALLACCSFERDRRGGLLDVRRNPAPGTRRDGPCAC